MWVAVVYLSVFVLVVELDVEQVLWQFVREYSESRLRPCSAFVLHVLVVVSVVAPICCSPWL